MKKVSKKDVLFGSGSFLALLSFIANLLNILGRPNIETYVIVAIFILLSAIIIFGFVYFGTWLNRYSINALKETNKTIQEQLNRLIDSQNNHIQKQDERFKRPEINSSSSND